MENVRKHRYIKLVTTERRTRYLVSETKFHTTKLLTENLLEIKMKQKICMNARAYLELSTLALSKMLIEILISIYLHQDYVNINV